MRLRSIHRRTLLKGLLGGSAVSVALPVLDLFVNSHGTAHADGSAFPRRFGLWFWGNGVHPERWVPEASGVDWALSEQLQPLADVKDLITVVSGLRVHAGNDAAHESGPAGFLTGAPLGGTEFGQQYNAPTLDQIVAQEIGGETRFRSLEVGVAPHTKGRSYSGPGASVPIETSPFALFERIFGAGFTAPGEDPMPDPGVGVRRSILDAVSEDSRDLMSIVGTSDRVRLEQHFDGIRELELRLARLQDSPPVLEACSRPEPPAEDYPSVDARPPLREINAAMTDVLAMALACDQTRVFSLWYSDGMDQTLHPDIDTGHHRLTHDEGDGQPKVNAITKYIVSSFRDTVERLSQVTEGDATLLDNSLVLATSDVSHGQRHSIDEFPVLLAGSGCGRIQQGIHYRSETDENVSKLGLTVLQTMGVQRDSFGAEEGLATAPLTGVEAT